MRIENRGPIGNHFKKENIFLCTVTDNGQSLVSQLKEKISIPENIPEEVLELLINNGVISNQQYDIFYQDENGYTRFVEEGPETFKGDNSDGKGIIENVVSVWDYYDEEDLFEGIVNGNLVILVGRLEPLEKYNEDYNLQEVKGRGLK